MKSIRVGIVCSLFLLIAISVPGALDAGAAGGALDGKTFTIMMGETGKKGDKDELVFKNGMFSSVECGKYGFGDAAYTTTVKHNTTTFAAVTKSAKEGEMKWSGTMKGGKLTGMVVWTKEGQKPIEYWFKTAPEK